MQLFIDVVALQKVLQEVIHPVYKMLHFDMHISIQLINVKCLVPYLRFYLLAIELNLV